jgi:hypothetical protein
VSIKAITIWQPWASLIVAGAKPYEFRRWPAPRSLWGKRIAIHAGARAPQRKEICDPLLRLPYGADGGTGLLRHVAQPLLERWLSAPCSLPLSSILGTALLQQPVRCIDLPEAIRGDSQHVDHDMWAWPLADVRALEPIAPARGAQGFWPWAA